MELAFIREFVTLAEIRKFSAAAQQLHISQSTLSRHIQTLETELGCTLFTRTTRDVELSACGALYLPYAKKIAHIAGPQTHACGNTAASSGRRSQSASSTIRTCFRLSTV